MIRDMRVTKWDLRRLHLPVQCDWCGTFTKITKRKQYLRQYRKWVVVYKASCPNADKQAQRRLEDKHMYPRFEFFDSRRPK